MSPQFPDDSSTEVWCKSNYDVAIFPMGTVSAHQRAPGPAVAACGASDFCVVQVAIVIESAVLLISRMFYAEDDAWSMLSCSIERLILVNLRQLDIGQNYAGAGAVHNIASRSR